MKTLRYLVLAACVSACGSALAAGGMMPMPPPIVESAAPAPSPAPGAPATPAVAAPPEPGASAAPGDAARKPAAPEASEAPDGAAETGEPGAASEPASAATTASTGAAGAAVEATSPTTAARVRPRMAPGFAPRGTIRDFSGKALVADGPCWDVGVRYELIAALASPKNAALQKAYIAKIALQRAKAPGGAEGPSPERLAKGLEKQVQDSWADIAEVGAIEPAELESRAKRAVAQVERMKAAVARARGEARQIAEERGFRTVVRVFGADTGKELSARLDKLPWIKLTASQSRFSEGTESLVHVLGRVGKADAKRAAADPLANDPDRALAPGDACGISGAERLGDAVLRPWVDANGGVHAGQDVTLTVDAKLQNDIYRILETAVKKSMNPCGGAAVVLDVATGEVRALVSYPAHAYDLSTADAQKLADDARWTPMRFRAVSSQFPPGSTIKPVTLYTGLAKGIVTPETKVDCTGTFKKEIPNSFRCWVFNRTGGNHGEETGETALRDSCNIYFYTAGDKLGAEPLIEQFGKLGMGLTQGTGLIEESPGILPTAEWVSTHRKKTAKYQRSDAWNYAFGQGELTVTPLQMANLAATLARGHFQQVTLMKDAKATRLGVERAPGETLDESYLATVRKGLWRVVNEKGGTADVAKLDRSDAVLCGKTGSAQAVSRVVSQRFTFKTPEGQTETIDAPTVERAKAQAPAGATLAGRAVQERYPETEDDTLPSHAWFIGYTQDPKTARGAQPQGKAYAISVLVEYGGAGGAVASPIARDIARRVYAGPGAEESADAKKPAEKAKGKDKAKPAAKPKPKPEPKPDPTSDEEEDEEN